MQRLAVTYLLLELASLRMFTPGRYEETIAAIYTGMAHARRNLASIHPHRHGLQSCFLVYEATDETINMLEWSIGTSLGGGTVNGRIFSEALYV